MSGFIMATTAIQIFEELAKESRNDLFWAILELFDKDHYTVQQLYKRYLENLMKHDGNVAILMRGFCHIFHYPDKPTYLIFGSVPWTEQMKFADYNEQIYELYNGYAEYADDFDLNGRKFVIISWEDFNAALEENTLEALMPFLTVFMQVCLKHTGHLKYRAEFYGSYSADPMCVETLQRYMVEYFDRLRDIIKNKVETIDLSNLTRTDKARLAIY